jgi:hypothetical protein
MVVRYLTNNNSVTPIDTAEKFSGCNGGGWAAFSESCFVGGVTGTKISQDKIVDALQKKHPVIMRIRTGGYINPLKNNQIDHSRGHYVVIKATTDGYYITADPNGSENEKYSTDSSKYVNGFEFYSFSR